MTLPCWLVDWGVPCVHLEGLLPAHGAGQPQMVPMCSQRAGGADSPAVQHSLTPRKFSALLQPPRGCAVPQIHADPHRLCSKAASLGEFVLSFSPLIKCRFRRDHSAPKLQKAALASVVRALPTTWKNGKVNSPLLCWGFQ